MSTMKQQVPEMRFPGFTEPWEQRKLGDVLEDLYNGQTPSRANPSYWNGNIKWLSSGELNRGIVSECSEYITEEGRNSSNLRIVPKGTFVMAITGLEAAGTRGNCGILDFDTTLNQSCMALFPNHDQLCTEYLFQWYRMIGEEYGIRFTQGTKQQSYNAEIIKELAIVLPKVDEQKRISEVLFKIDNLITLHQRKCDDLKEYKKGLLQQMFHQPGEAFPRVRFPGFTEPWEQRKVGEYYEFKNGLNKGKEFFGSGTPIVNFTDVFHNRGIETTKLKGRVTLEPSEIKNFEVKKGDIFFTRTSETIEEIGYPSVMLDEPENTVFSGFVLRGRCFLDQDPLDDLFKKYVFFTESFRNEMLKKSSMTTRALTSGTSIKEMVFFHPSSKLEQRKIGELLSQIDNSITLHQRKCDELKIFKNGLLKKMFV